MVLGDLTDFAAFYRFLDKMVLKSMGIGFWGRFLWENGFKMLNVWNF
jgi:hypothetical protein